MDDLDLPDEGFSMSDLEKDLKKGRGARRLPWLLTGLVLGIGGTIAVPRFAGPYLPDVLRGSREILSGPVLAEERDGDRLLLTIETEAGALIASFSERVAEIGMLVDPGDVVTIAVPDYEPFVENPDFKGVRKHGADGEEATPVPGGEAGAGGAGEPAASEVPAAEGTGATAGAGGGSPAATADTMAGVPADTRDTTAGVPADTVPPDSTRSDRR